MDAATATRPEWTNTLTARPGSSRHGRRGRPAAVERRRRRRRSFHIPALILLLAATMALRLWGIKQGLPFSYNVDEAEHFVPRAVGFFSQNLNPNYFLNPPAYSYLLHIVFELWFGSADAVTRAYTNDPTAVFVVARVVAAALGTIAVLFTYLAAERLLDRSVALLAAGIFGLSFLPIFYSHLALNDVPALAPLTLALYGAAGVLRHGRLRDYLIAGVAIGLAAATKYTGGIAVICLIAAALCDGFGPRRWRAPLFVLAAGLAAVAAFVIANPYSVLDFSAFTAGLSQQASGADLVKLGASQGSGILYYIWTFTWGMGTVPALAGLCGAVLLLVRRRFAVALVLLPTVIAFIVFMGLQTRFFGRWLMPMFPIVAIVGAYAAVELIRWLHRHRRIPLALGGLVVSALLLTQSLTTVIHNDQALSRPDTRNLTRDWMVKHILPGTKVVIEPVVPSGWGNDIGTSGPWTRTGSRWYQYATWLTDYDAATGALYPAGERKYVTVDQYEKTLRPELLNEYVEQGYCWVVIGSLQAGRAFAQPGAAPRAIRYYAALANRAKLEYTVSPFAPRSHPVPFSFDWSIDYYPRQYRLPGPEMSVYRLTGGKCS
ncbi:MAG TPA: glycosyltransferase family 39 protein [Solirubrobacteraceae bacterium]|jgi:4-amino-4-deoxy-L-arabinose transferase-like glycosyltransferase|nr:glycosyltransferase family 39 protein [Solirubrobacteraceae bacterium]